jgi:ribosomal protein S27E
MAARVAALASRPPASRQSRDWHRWPQVLHLSSVSKATYCHFATTGINGRQCTLGCAGRAWLLTGLRDPPMTIVRTVSANPAPVTAAEIREGPPLARPPAADPGSEPVPRIRPLPDQSTAPLHLVCPHCRHEFDRDQAWLQRNRHSISCPICGRLVAKSYEEVLRRAEQVAKGG